MTRSVYNSEVYEATRRYWAGLMSRAELDAAILSLRKNLRIGG